MPLSDELQTEVSGAASVDDPRWQIIERIISSPCFQRSERLKAFLKYVAQQYLSGHADRLTGHQIGRAVFGKTADDQSEDNTVRIYARQLRLRLLEYFDTYGRDETYVVEIPKGSYVPVFRALHNPTETGPSPELNPDTIIPVLATESALHKPPFPLQSHLGWIVATVLAIALVISITSSRTGNTHTNKDALDLWPLSEVGSPNEQTQIVLCDNSFALYQVTANHHFSLSDYLKPEYPRNIISAPEVSDSGVQELVDQLGRKQITSYADAATASRISHLELPGNWVTRPARDIKLREVQEGNYLFLGSSWSNPWVELYESRLNFVLTTHPPLGIVNKRPGPGELASYISQGRTGNMGDDYAAIAVIPNEKHGIVMIVQGTKEEGTEAAGMFIADPTGRQILRKRLGIKANTSAPVFFEALLRTKTFAGASAETEVIAVHRVEGRAQ